MGDYIAVYIPSPNGQSTGGIFKTVKDATKCASTPEAKASGGARFKRFSNREDAKAFVERGNDSRTNCNSPVFSPERPSPSSSQTSSNSYSESISSYPSVSPIVLNRLRRAIETKNKGAFVGFVKENPRCLINVCGDKPTIIFEGCRYNVLHIAAKCGNCFVIQYVLKFICDLNLLLDVYGTSIKDVRNRSVVLLDSYLNTPDKGCGDIPLHFASKFGHKEAVEIFLTYEQTEKDRLNNDQKSPLEVCVTRYNGPDKEEIREKIQRLFCSFYVPLYRPLDNSTSAIIFAPGAYPSKTLSKNNIGQPYTAIYTIAAVAGPFDCMERAQNFQKEWINEKRDKRLRDPLKGAEEVGRCLAKANNVKWVEKWPFSQELINLSSREGLAILNKFLMSLQRKQQDESERLDNIEDYNYLHKVRRRLVFDDLSDSDDDDFVDALDYFECPKIAENSYYQYESSSNFSRAVSESSSDAIDSLIQHMHLLRLNDSFELDGAKDKLVVDGTGKNSLCNCDNSCAEFVKSALKRECPDELLDFEECTKFLDEVFYTPPSSPTPVYISDEVATKDDEDLLVALKLVEPDLISEFYAVEEYIRKLEKIPASKRAVLPYTDSPRRVKFKRNHIRRYD
uniref:ANK_REP_REGION domain-containing protein n=1 Tax=Syphacia muris TaxID=451379 RepID=A0A158R4A4_9BILA